MQLLSGPDPGREDMKGRLLITRSKYGLRLQNEIRREGGRIDARREGYVCVCVCVGKENELRGSVCGDMKGEREQKDLIDVLCE